jgi:dTDP-4-dehydrorhamnose 3,5-epimerase
VDHSILKKINLTPLKKINVEGGDVMHAIKNTDKEFRNFGELYFSFINNGSVKAWKRHKKMTMNLFVPVGSVSFVFYDDVFKEFLSLEIGCENYHRLTVPPGIIFGFKGKNKDQSLVVNFADIPHNSNEVEKIKYEDICFEWGKI